MKQSATRSETIMVTGAAGLVGRAVVGQLAARGQAVLALDRRAARIDQIDVIECDTRDIHRLNFLARQADIGAIVHCGTYSGPMVGRGNPYDMMAVNVMGTANVLELARISGMRRFVYCSSASVYGSTAAGPVQEDSALSPSTLYGATKLAAEQLVLAYAREQGVDAAALRLSWIYGPNRETACVLRKMIDDAAAGRPTRLGWGMDFHRQYIHSDDVARAVIATLDAPLLRQRVYNITGESFVTLGAVADIVRTALPQAEIELAPGPDPQDDDHHRLDTRAAREELGFRPQISLEEGIGAMIATLAARNTSKKDERQC